MIQDQTLQAVLNELNKITHDLNNSMFVINASISLLKTADQYDHDTLLDMEQSGYQATKLVAQLANLSKAYSISCSN